MSQPFLSGLRILDFSTVVMGPYATQLLSDMGADVIKVEPPGGDLVRFYRPQRSSEFSGLFLSLHRNKRGIVLDLKQAGASDVLARLVRKADVVLHNFRPAVAVRLGLDYETLREMKHEIIVCRTVGFGEDGPRREDPAYDDVIQAASGLADLSRLTTGRPAYVPSMICDKVVGQAAALAISGAAFRKATTGTGCEIEVPMYETMVAFNLAENFASATFDPPLGDFGWARSVSPMRKPFPTSDGYVCLLPYTNRNWMDFLAVGGQEHLITDKRYATLADRALNIDGLYRVVETITPLKTAAEWIAFCQEKQIPASRVSRLGELLEEEHLIAVEMFQRLEHPTEGAYRVCRSGVRDSEVRWTLRRHAPALGEHTREVLVEAGFTDSEIDALNGNQIVKSGQVASDRA
ncbi:CaiB/BaiF CoA transferase family protein [Rhodopseudomonas pseudopalustris]|uniref:Crotonobetainyl-CoA:carnitine CoA-transferase CaiB n=1 Tax=Rhodopseudomonas pseudopalustris TaxID=1513892 RepID=A0A1H8M8E5_9BRAD|nr:CoA transferase [Rhodopseudomonas pseudopalustris]SEO13631.1 Crotonobetainyl-CoA:carnitine CoA-transferase CaiB [Rhodopseudomonas pseudopalustris]